MIITFENRTIEISEFEFEQFLLEKIINDQGMWRGTKEEFFKVATRSYQIPGYIVEENDDGEMLIFTPEDSIQ